MRLFTITDTTSPFKLVEITRIVLHAEDCEVHLAKWHSLEQYHQHGDQINPMATEQIRLPSPPPNHPLLENIYAEVAKTLPSHQIIFARPRE